MSRTGSKKKGGRSTADMGSDEVLPTTKRQKQMGEESTVNRFGKNKFGYLGGAAMNLKLKEFDSKTLRQILTEQQNAEDKQTAEQEAQHCIVAAFDCEGITGACCPSCGGCRWHG